MEPNICCPTYAFGWLIGLGIWANPCKSLVEGIGKGKRERDRGRGRVGGERERAGERGERRGEGGKQCISFLDFLVNDPTDLESLERKCCL